MCGMLLHCHYKASFQSAVSGEKWWFSDICDEVLVKQWKQTFEKRTNRIQQKVQIVCMDFLQRQLVLMQHENSFLQESSCHRDLIEAIGWKLPARSRSRTIRLLARIVVFKNESGKVTKRKRYHRKWWKMATTAIMSLMSIFIWAVWICYEFLMGSSSPVSSNTLSVRSIKGTPLRAETETRKKP